MSVRLARALGPAAWLMLASCGGSASGELTHRARSAERTVAVQAVAQAPSAKDDPEAREPAAMELPSLSLTSKAHAAARVMPDPVRDARAEAQAHEELADAALDERYPMHAVAFHLSAQVFVAPDTSSQVVGLVRRGTPLRLSAPVRGKAEGCNNTWHELATGGFVCRGLGFQIGREPQRFEPSPLPAALHDALPYRYAKNTQQHALQYWKLPSESEQTAAKTAFADWTPPDPTLPAEQQPAVAAPVPELVRMAMEPGFYVSVDREEADGARTFARTVRGNYVDVSALIAPKPALHAGGALLEGETLPLGIVYRESTQAYDRDPLTGALSATAELPRFTRVALTGARETVGNRTYYVTRSGQRVLESKLRVIDRVQRPALVPKHSRLIHVHLAQQTVVAYEGERPVYAALVSSGKESHETPMGLYRIQAKHVSATMDGLAGTEDSYSIEDVPWTMYFQGGFALHAAFWHDRFGNTRSHGCVNLAPGDARWLFEWSGPSLPVGYHAILSTKERPGTFVWID